MKERLINYSKRLIESNGQKMPLALENKLNAMTEKELIDLKLYQLVEWLKEYK